jgi:hypothetical protein
VACLALPDFSKIISQTSRFSGGGRGGGVGGLTEHKMCVMIFFTTFV